jgi:hypothetical protein
MPPYIVKLFHFTLAPQLIAHNRLLNSIIVITLTQSLTHFLLSYSDTQ